MPFAEREEKTAKSSTLLLTLADLRPKLNLDVLNDCHGGILIDRPRDTFRHQEGKLTP